jgi:Ca2+-binding RTX toxin-like protein
MSTAYVLANPFPLTGNEIVDVTTNGYKWYFPEGANRTLNWSVSSSLWRHPILQSTETQADFTRAFGNIAEFINVDFNFLGYITDSNGLTGYENAYLKGSDLNITYAYNGVNTAGNTIFDKKFTSNSQTAFCYFPDLDNNSKYLGAAGDTFLNYNNSLLASASFENKTNSFAILLHEILHGLGLKHPHDSGGTGRPTYSNLDIKFADRQWISVMSYDMHENGGDGAYSGSQPIGPMLFDAIALQYLYGESTFNSGDTAYDLTRYLGDYFNCQWDASGTDLLDATNLTYGVVIELDGGQLSNGWNSHHVGFITTASDYLALSLNNPTKWTWLWGEYENVNGSSYNDIISGNDLNNIINGGAGDDYLTGGSGNDTFDWDSSLRNGNDIFIGGLGDDIYVIDSFGDIVQENSFEGVDTVFVGFNYSIINTYIENIKSFSNQSSSVTFTGNSWNNVLEGGSANDILYGNGGSDTIKGGLGNDLIDGGDGTDYAIYSSNFFDLNFQVIGLSVTVTSNIEGVDTLRNVEYIRANNVEYKISNIVASADTLAPTLISSKPADNAAAVPIGSNIVLSFSEPIQKGTGNIVISSGTDIRTISVISAQVAVSGSTVTINPTADFQANSTYYVQLASGVIKDLAGNNYVGISNTTTLNFSTPDTIAPSMAIASSASILRISQTSTLTFTLSEASTSFTASDVTVIGGTLSNFSGSGTTYTALFTPAANSVTDAVIRVANGVFTDAAGNANTDGSDANNTLTMTVNTVSPINTLLGTSVNDVLASTSGNDSISAGTGLDIVVYQGPINQYSIQINRAAKTATVTDSQSVRDAQDTLIDVEKLQFGNQTFDLFNLPRTETPTHSKTNSFLFDASYYLMSHPDLASTVNLQGAFGHYLSTGAANGNKPNMWFDPAYYANRWPDLKPLNLTPDILFQHYNLFGVWEGRSAGPMFDQYDGNRYLAENPDVGAYVDGNLSAFLGSRSNGAIAHYIIYGADEGRVAFNLNGAQLETAVLIGIPIIDV